MTGMWEFPWAIQVPRGDESAANKKFLDGLIAFQGGDVRSAILRLDDAVNTYYFSEKELGQIYAQLGIAYEKNNQTDMAERSYMRSIHFYPLDHTSRLYFVNCLLNKGENIDDIREHVIMTLLTKPDELSLYNIFSSAYDEAYLKTSDEHYKNYSLLIRKTGEDIKVLLGD